MEYLNVILHFYQNDSVNGELNIRTQKGGEYEINYVTIPKEIIYDKDLGNKRVIVYSFLCCRRALDDSVGFSVPELVKWTGLIPNYHKGKINPSSGTSDSVRPEDLKFFDKMSVTYEPAD